MGTTTARNKKGHRMEVGGGKSRGVQKHNTRKEKIKGNQTFKNKKKLTSQNHMRCQ